MNERRNSGDHKSSVLVHMSLNGWEDKINSKSFFSVANISVRELTDRDSKDSEILFGLSHVSFAMKVIYKNIDVKHELHKN